MVPGVAERERAPLREQWVDWMRVAARQQGRLPLYCIGNGARDRWSAAATGAQAGGRLLGMAVCGMRRALPWRLLQGY